MGDYDKMRPLDDQSISGDHSSIQYPDSAVAIVGVACRFAGADSLEQFWDILETGQSQCVDLPKDRFPDSRFARFKRNFRANVMKDVDAFDHKFFHVSSREASFRDPHQRIALEVTYQALESAGYFSREITEEQRDMGCYFATSNNEYHENVVTHAPSAFSLTGSLRPFIAGQVAHHFGFTGPSIMLDAACAASGVAVNTACRAVASGECKSAIAGGTNLLISPHTFQDLACGHFTSPTGPSKSFDAAADGYGRGEGVAAIVVKRLDDAVRDGDVIKGVISATAANQCAPDCPITVPHGPSQSALYRKALRLAQLDASQVGYVEAHGTGTRVGDPIEAESIRAVFGDLNRSSDARTYMGSLKSNIGHTEASAGLSGLIKVMLMIEKGIIPPQALFSNLNPDIPALEPSGLAISTGIVPWQSEFRAGCVNNYGASGANSVMILTQPPVSPNEDVVPRFESCPISITAFSQTSLRSYCSSLLDFIDKSEANDALVRDVAFHLSRRRNAELPFSVTSTISSLQELRNVLVSAKSDKVQKQEYNKRPTVLFFGGQDGKTTSVSRALYESCAIFRRHLDDCEAALQTLGSPGMLQTLFEPNPSEKSSIIAHSKLFSVQYAGAKAWIDCGLQPSRLIGHSFGQITALCVSGALSLSDALHLVTTRARLIDESWGSDTGSMIAVEATEEELSALLAQHSDLALEIACYNGARSFVLAGATTSVDSLEAALKSSTKSFRFKRLQTSNAFHSALAVPLVEHLERLVQGFDLQEPQIPLETCSQNNTWSSIEPTLVAQQIRDPVFFYQAVQRIAKDLGSSVWIEAGSGENASLLRRALEPHSSSHDIKSMKMNSSTSVKSMADFTADLWRLNLKIQFWPFHGNQRHQYSILNLPPYQFDKSRHWLDWKESEVQPSEHTPSVPPSDSFVRLVRETGDRCEFRINKKFETWRSQCSENRILGISTCPTSLLLNIVFEALETMRSSSTHNQCVYRVQQLQIPGPIPADTDEALTLEIQASGSRRSWRFRLIKVSQNHELASGMICTGETEVQSDFVRFERLVEITRIQELEQDKRSDCVRGRGVYNFPGQSFQVSKVNQVIREVTARGSEATAALTSSSQSPLALLESLAHIPLICLNCIHDCPDDHFSINTAVGDAHFRVPDAPLLTDTATSWSVYVRFFGLEGTQPTCDMYVFDTSSGRLSAVILDVGFTRMATQTLRQILDGHSMATIPSHQAASSNLDSSEVPAARRERFQTKQDPEPYRFDDDFVRADTKPDLTEALYELLERVADVEADKLHESTLIADLGIDSLMLMEVADEINKFFATDIDVTELIVAEDIKAFCQLIADRSTGFSYSSGASSAAMSSSMTADSGVISSSSNTDISEINESHDTPSSKKSASSVLPAAFKAFEDIRTEFDVLAKETGCARFWSEVHPAQMRLVEAYILEAFTKLGYNLASLKAGERIPVIHHKAGHDKLLKQLMLVLRDTGLIGESGDDWIRTSKAIPSSQPSSKELFDHLQHQFPKWAPEHELLHVAGSNLAGHLDGTTNSLKVLFGSPEARKLMADQYRIAPIQSAVSKQLASFIEKCFSSRTPRSEPLKVLEVGGGTCGTTLYALDAFVKAGVPVEYTFTDISPSFIAAAKAKLKEYKFVKYHTLDISEAPPTEFRGQYDMILATNVIHATRDAGKSAGNVRQLLREGGFFTMVEYTHMYAAGDVIFGQLDGWWLFDDGRTHAIMNETQWNVTLKHAGFGRVDWTGSETRESKIARIFLSS